VTCGRLIVLSTTKTDRHDITEILLKVAFNTITPPPPPMYMKDYGIDLGNIIIYLVDKKKLLL
jgi:hypothetical protein